ncbi:MAG: hypothetical protein HZA79_01040 [Sphingobacteriales bacterium]|nr:hypothetical protein [Sphingobacteriales bacterium]
MNFRLNNGFTPDILTRMKGLEDLGFEKCLFAANKADIDQVLVPFLHINHLIAKKKAVNRPKDQLDVISLAPLKGLDQNPAEE